jgi:hypothetical protein
MSCELSQLKQYDLSSVTHDAAGRYIVQLKTPFDKCADGTFISHNADLRVDPNISTSLLRYDAAAHKVVILVPNDSFVQQISTKSSSGFSFIGALFWVAVVAFGIYFVRRFFAQRDQDDEQVVARERVEGFRPAHSAPQGPTVDHTHSATQAATPQAVQAQAPQAAHTTVVVNQRDSGDDFVTGVVLGSMLNRGTDREVIREERIIERDREYHDAAPAPTFSSDDDDSSVSSDPEPTFASDPEPTIESDPEPTIESDSDSSFSSDSSSDSFSSDSD